MAKTKVAFYVLLELHGIQEHPNETTNDSDIISDEVCQMVEIIFFVFLCGLLGVVGSAANVINVIIFCKQGFNDSINISLISLTISDLGILVTLVWASICYNPLFRYSNIEFDSIQVEYVTAGWPNGCCVRITCWITAFITFERCVCITLPMKVKHFITPKRTLIVVIVIYFITIVNAIPLYFSVYFSTLYQPKQNTTLVAITHVINGSALEKIVISVHVVAHISAVIIVIISAVFLIVNLKFKSQRRQKMIMSSKADSVWSRDKRVIKMVTIISCTFIVCYMPGTINMMLMTMFHDYNNNGLYHNSFSASWSIINTLEAINSSVNIVIYYNMSSKFRDDIRKHFNACFGNDKSI